jgi:catechol 2,3-dioxygenase-like lactoylglutathione lyase family enzyme
MVDLELGAFAVSLSVKDIVISKSFYEKMGFKQVGGELSENWVILRNGETTIGLFHGMFENNLLYFTPGWDKYGANLEEFVDIRDIQSRLKEAGLEVDSEIESEGSGPAFFKMVDPDGNQIWFDQHV